MKRILIFYSHFAPSFKGGGPVQSLVSLVETLKEEYTFDVVCSAYEVGETKPLSGIKVDEWNRSGATVKIFYASKINYKLLISLFKESNPAIVYINGIYLPFYNWLPLYIAKKQKRKIVWAARGMLQPAALAVKPFKKKIFLKFLKFFRFYKNVTWHATDRQEGEDIEMHYGVNTDIKIVPNIPKTPPALWRSRSKSSGELKLVFLSLITEMKNLQFVLEILKEMEKPITFDIYGPIKDIYYWQICQSLMQHQIHNIQYKGVANPHEVQNRLQEYHAFILPTKGENFGHAIYEALSAGTVPVISSFTPWGMLQQRNAGITVASWDIDEWANGINTMVNLSQEEFDKLSQNSFHLAKEYFEGYDFKAGYNNLFG